MKAPGRRLLQAEPRDERGGMLALLSHDVHTAEVTASLSGGGLINAWWIAQRGMHRP
jgi:hypothetical protein